MLQCQGCFCSAVKPVSVSRWRSVCWWGQNTLLERCFLYHSWNAARCSGSDVAWRAPRYPDDEGGLQPSACLGRMNTAKEQPALLYGHKENKTPDINGTLSTCWILPRESCYTKRGQKDLLNYPDHFHSGYYEGKQWLWEKQTKASMSGSELLSLAIANSTAQHCKHSRDQQQSNFSKYKAQKYPDTRRTPSSRCTTVNPRLTTDQYCCFLS